MNIETLSDKSRRVLHIGENAPQLTPTMDIRIPEWVQDAQCGSTDPEIFFPGAGGSGMAAKAICSQCPVVADCLEWALGIEGRAGGLDHGLPHGIYGGLSPQERLQILRRRGGHDCPEPECGYSGRDARSVTRHLKTNHGRAA